jgi:hypothetical protein
MQAAWTGLIVAEAVLLAERPVASIRISACLATQSFSVARTYALWNHVPVEDIIKRFDTANRLCRSDSVVQRGESRIGKLRSSLQPLWDTLVILSQGREATKLHELEPIIAALQGLGQARTNKDQQEARHLVRPLMEYAPEADSFDQLSNLEPEMRLRLFDKLIDRLNESASERTNLRHNALALLAGYLATVAAGGAPSLSLAESNSARWPEITAWAYLIGGIGENVVWTSSFDGLGRLVARELRRPLRLDESPTCDFAFDEANVLADSKLADPLVHLRIKQARLVTVALLPGVNVAIPIGDAVSQGASNTDVSRSTRPLISDPIAAFVDALWPHLQRRIEDYLREDTSYDTERGQRNRDKRRPRSQAQLPIGDPKKYRP